MRSGWSREILARLAFLAAIVCLIACDGPGRVQYDNGRCLDNGRPLTVQEVEADEAEVARRIASRQPWFAVITIGIVLLAAAGNAEKARHNLDAIQSTAGDIRTLVGQLPPDEQRKAQAIVTQLNSALAKQGKIVGDYVARTDEAEKDLSTHTMATEKGLASVKGELGRRRGGHSALGSRDVRDGATGEQERIARTGTFTYNSLA